MKQLTSVGFMKRLLKWGAVVLLVAAAAMVVVYRAVNQAPSADLPQNERVYEILVEGGCLSCHSADPELPFYANRFEGAEEIPDPDESFLKIWDSIIRYAGQNGVVPAFHGDRWR